MDISYLETVLAVAKYRSFSRAAEEIPCSQATVSRQINDVENSLGYEIFTRTSKRGIVNVSESGHLAIQRIAKIVDEYKNLFCRSKGAKTPAFRLGLSAGLFNYKAKANIVSCIFEKYPFIDLTLVDVDRTNWLNMIAENQIDGMLNFTVVDTQKQSHEPSFSQQNGLSYTFLKRQYPSIAVPQNHRLASQACVSMEDLAQETFLFNRDISVLNGQSRDLLIGGFLHSCELAGFIPNIASQEKSGTGFANVRDIVITENGWVYPTFQSDSWCRNDNIAFVPIKDPIYYAEIFFITKEDVQPLNTPICDRLMWLYSE